MCFCLLVLCYAGCWPDLSATSSSAQSDTGPQTSCVDEMVGVYIGFSATLWVMLTCIFTEVTMPLKGFCFSPPPPTKKKNFLINLAPGHRLKSVVSHSMVTAALIAQQTVWSNSSNRVASHLYHSRYTNSAWDCGFRQTQMKTWDTFTGKVQ